MHFDSVFVFSHATGEGASGAQTLDAALFWHTPRIGTTPRNARNLFGFVTIGGLSSSTILTLFVVPAAYMVPGDINNLARRAVEMARRINPWRPIVREAPIKPAAD